MSALVNGVEGGKWYSLMDKVVAPKTLELAWARVRANAGTGSTVWNAGRRPGVPRKAR